MDQIGNDKVYRLRKKEREMGVEMSEVGGLIRKFAISSIRTCYRSVFNHPFFVGMALFLFFMHKSFPLLFSLFVSASPVLVCTAVLLGTLLSFGQPYIPEIEKEANTNHEILSLKTAIPRDSTIVERDERFIVERHTDAEVEINDANLVLREPPMEENSRKNQIGKSVAEREKRELHVSGFEQNTETNKEKVNNAVFLENQYCRIVEIEDENAEVSLGKSSEVLVDDSPISPWGPVDEEDEGVDDNETSDSGSDGDESSSPDASMTDIIPMLDELHPLLDEDASHPADAGSERSQQSGGSTNESIDDESEHQEEEIGDGDDNDEDDEDEEEEEETLGGNEDAIKSAIKWTEDDQKNLMDLGTSELERNQRLENLIARRRARRIMAEKNLMDFESSDLPFNIPPISTTCSNPFDLPYDSNDNSTVLPPIPGSAPSILLPRHNPFDIPYDLSEEKPDLKDDCFQQDTFFCRHESFNLGPSFFGPSKHEKQDTKLSSYSLPECVNLEGTIYSSFHKQSGEPSDSKASSVLETESVCSAGDRNDKDLVEDKFSVLISDVGHPSVHVGHGSESSEDIESVQLGQDEKRHVECDEIRIELEDEQIHCEMVSSFSETALPGEHDMGEIQLNKRADEVNYSCRSSSSSSSEVHETIFDEKEVQPKNEENVVDKPSLEESGIYNTMVLVFDSHHKEPVYDSSPPPVQKYLSSSSVSSDSEVETSKMGFTPVLVKRIISSADTETEVTQSIVGYASCNKQVSADSSNVDSVDENGGIRIVIAEKAERILVNHGLSGGGKQLDTANATSVPEFCTYNELKKKQPSVVVFEQVSGSHVASSSENESPEELPLDNEVSFEIKQDQVHSSGPDINFHVGIDDEVNEGQSGCACQEKPIFDLEKQLEELVVPQIIKRKLDTSEFQLQNGGLTNMYSKLPFEVSETKFPTASADLEGVEHPDHIQVQSFNFQIEPTGSQVNDEIKEINEGLLMELDAIGDFNVDEFGSNANNVENNRVSGKEMNSEIPPDSNFRKTEALEQFGF